nr:MAG TPA: hypothetical protein [Caudoviricetes sp.]
MRHELPQRGLLLLRVPLAPLHQLVEAVHEHPIGLTRANGIDNELVGGNNSVEHRPVSAFVDFKITAFACQHHQVGIFDSRVLLRRQTKFLTDSSINPILDGSVVREQAFKRRWDILQISFGGVVQQCFKRELLRYQMAG